MNPARRLVAVCVLGVAMAALASGGALATLTTLEEYSIETPSAVTYESRETYTGPEANATRRLADTDLNRVVDTEEAEVYVSNLKASMEQTQPSWIRWDGAPVTWIEISLSATGLDGNVNSTRTATVLYTGRFAAVPSPSTAHTLAVETAPHPWTITLRVPHYWRYGQIYGADTTQPDSTEMRLQAAGGLVTAQVFEPPPASLLPFAALTGLLLAAVVTAAVVMKRRRASRAAKEPGASVVDQERL